MNLVFLVHLERYLFTMNPVTRMMVPLLAVKVGLALAFYQPIRMVKKEKLSQYQRQRHLPSLSSPLHLLRSSTASESTNPIKVETNQIQTQTATIIGAGPAGLATAIMLAKRGMNDIHVYDRLPAPAASDDASVWSDTAKFYLIGLGGRGQKALQELDGDNDNSSSSSKISGDGESTWDKVEKNCVTVLGRKDWAPGAGENEGVERIFGDERPYKTKVIPRDRLAGVMREVALDSYGNAITLHYNTEMTAVKWEKTSNDKNGSGSDETAVITLEACDENSERVIVDIRCELLVGADGTTRALAIAMEKSPTTAVRVMRYEDDNRRVYKTVPMTIPTNQKGWRCDVNYSARTKDGRVILDALPANTNGEYCAVLLLKADDEFAQPNSSPEGLRALFNVQLPQFSHLVSDDTIKAVAAKSPSNIPRFRYVGPELHKGSSTVLLGDSIHTVKPYFGLGVNSALEDVSALRTALDRHPTDRAKALAAYSSARAEEAEALVRISRGLDRPGLLGFLTFILPIILDGVFQSLAPQFFELNTIALLQRDGISFAEVGKIKRRDRILQIILLGFGAATVSALTSALISFIASVSSSSTDTNALPAAGVGVGLFLFVALGASQVLRVWEPGMAPADVLAKTLQPVTDVISAEDRGKITDDEDDDNDNDNSSGGNAAKPLHFIGKGGLPLL